ncbi:MAG: pyruvate kinase [Flavobacteriales bacterium]
MKRTKIVATMGPASLKKETLKEMMQAGLNVCRLNFSHGSHQDHAGAVALIRELNEELGLNVAILADLQGPKIRTHEMENNGVLIEVGQQIDIVVDKVVGNNERFSINYNLLPRDVNPGERILLDDGKLVLKVLETDKKSKIRCEVVQGGLLCSKKGVNFPNTKISMPSLTEKDIEDLNFALKLGVDWIGLSFVRTAKCITDLKERIAKKRSIALVVAKIEKPEALENIDEIIEASDALMVARGDLGVEIPYQNVPLIQKMIISKSISKAKPVIVATQMMESMLNSLTPSRAEVNDVANAVLDGADAVMLSGETSVGQYPVQVVQTMANIITEMEGHPSLYHKEELPPKGSPRFISDSICFNACRLAQRVEAKGIITMTYSGYTAYKIASQRPESYIYVFTSNRKILTQLNLVWGVRAFFYNKRISTDHTIADIKHLMKEDGYLHAGDVVINVASIPLEDLGGTNMLKLSYVD